MKNRLNNQKGLTLVELLAVIVILGIIAAIAVPAVSNIIEKSREDAHIANAESLYDAARLAVVSENVSGVHLFYVGTEPGSLESTSELAEAGKNNSLDSDYIEQMPINPQTGDPYDDAYVVYDGSSYYVQLVAEGNSLFNTATAADGVNEVYTQDGLDALFIQDLRSLGKDGLN